MKLSETGYYEEPNLALRKKMLDTWLIWQQEEELKIRCKRVKSDLRALKKAQKSKRDAKT